MANCLLPAGQAWYSYDLHSSITIRLLSYCSKHCRCKQLVKEVQLTRIWYVQACVYTSLYGELIIDQPHSQTPPVPIMIIFIPITIAVRPWDTLACCWDVKQPTNKLYCCQYSSQTLLASLTSMLESATASRSTKSSARKRKNRSSLSESLKRSILKTINVFLQLDFQKLSHFRFIHKDSAVCVDKVAEVL